MFALGLIGLLVGGVAALFIWPGSNMGPPVGAIYGLVIGLPLGLAGGLIFGIVRVVKHRAADADPARISAGP